MKPDYTIYDRGTVEGRAERRDYSTVLLTHDEVTRVCYLIVSYDYFGITDVSHIAFYAASEGWEDLTETGFRSTFLDTRIVQPMGEDAGAILAAIYENAGVKYRVSPPIQPGLF
ncbi:hypothetical protein [Sedimenticola thiotaurini]|uniref:Uncharacterized protein n=1 Tax=Sedimenticola thiotaurini TaxID=1543721 RepID=A0A0F7K572_9GAMM|nr:hypothetical protein [Sedimenticola thiotaurini]AKH22395.1 hypothetical protein AAY24_18205 [Sedimenticola thiotaurini]